jgi:NADPH-dependent curcumin reductase CurA
VASSGWIDRGEDPLCGQISQYDRSERQGLRNADILLEKCNKLQGFRIGGHLARRAQALEQLLAWYRAERPKFCETVAEGLAAASAALISMLSGRNIRRQAGLTARAD